MKNNANKIVKIICVIVAVLMLAMLIMQFQPFWSANEDSASVAGYVALPKSHTGLNKYFKNYFKTEYDVKFTMHYVFPMPVVVFLCCVLGLFMCAYKFGSFLSFILPTVAGIYGAQGYLMNIVFRMGANWQFHTAICIAMAAVGIVGMIVCCVPAIVSLIQYAKKKKEK